MKSLVTGGAGFIGSNLSKELSKEYNVTIVDDLSSSRLDFYTFLKSMPEVNFINRCFSDDATLEKIRKKQFFCVFHVAAIPRVSYSVENPSLTTDVNILKTVKLMEACIGNIQRFVFSSSSSVYGDHPGLPKVEDKTGNVLSPYAATKAIDEIYGNVFTKCYGMECIGLRYFNVFGPRQDPNGAYAAVIPKFIALAFLLWS